MRTVKNSSSKVVVTGYPYAFPRYRKVFEYTLDRNRFTFILPRVWKSKTVVKTVSDKKNGIYTVTAWSYGRASLLGGLFKGFTPGIILRLKYLRFFRNARVLYSCLEPNLLSTLYNGICAKMLGMKHIIFTWQNVSPEKRLSGIKLRVSNAIVRANLWLADGVICGNQKSAEVIKRFKVQDPRFKVVVCPLSGVDADRFRPGITSNWRSKFEVADDAKLILFAGAMDKRKGLDMLLRAFRTLVVDYRLRTVLVIVGTGSECDNLVKLSAELQIMNQVRFVDWMDNNELPNLMNVADIFVYPSVPRGGWEEQFGYSMAEASACEKPVVATRTGSIDEIVCDGESGILVDPNNSEQLSAAMAKLLSSDSLCKQMGQFGRQHVIKNFSHRAIAVKIEGFLLS